MYGRRRSSSWIQTRLRGRRSSKLEFLQHTGTFKARGAFNRMLAARARGELDAAVGIVVASGGNAGMANAFAAARLGVPATRLCPGERAGGEGGKAA